MDPTEYTTRGGRRSKRRRDDHDDTVLFGLNPVVSQLRRDPQRIRRVWVARGPDRALGQAIDLARAGGIEIRFEDRRELDRRTSGAVHQGIVAAVGPFGYADLHDVLGDRPECLLAADQVSDPRNLGALARSAEAAGVGGLILPRDRSAGVTPVAEKAAAGAMVSLPVVRVTNLARTLRELKDAGYWVVGLDADGEESLHSFSFPDRCVIVAGSEGRGLRPLTRASCDYRVSIPMVGRVESLNVSVAVAVACFERLRQRHRVDSPPAR